jgi:alkylation response protein AidB-like acyl-CoA dehydrogenase
MTFDLTPELAAQQLRAREVAAAIIAPAASEIDERGVLPPAARSALDELGMPTADPLALALIVEEIAAASGSAAAITGLGAGPSAGLAGLRGAPRVDQPSDRHYLIMAAACVGVGRAALAEALAAARARGDRPAGEPGDPPHWALADAATEMEGARLLVHASATGGEVPAAAAFVHAAGAAARAVDAALRLVGPEGYTPGSVLERTARDARSAWLLLGSEDHSRRIAADELLA